MADDLMVEVDGLLAEREKYASWLQRLESERDKVSPRAFERVHQDYKNRLEEVDRQLEEHSEAIGGRLEELESELEAVERQRTERADDLEEARLRHSVGEYRDPDEWEELEGQLEEAVREADDKLTAVRDEIGKLRGILGQVRTEEGAAAASENGVRQSPEAPAATADGARIPAGRAKAPGDGDGHTAAPGESGDAGSGFGREAEAESDGVRAEGASDVVDVEDLDLDADAQVAELSDEEVGPTEAEPADAAGSAGVDDGVSAGEEAADEGDELEDELAFLESLSLDSNDELDSLMFLEEKGRGQPQTVICPQCSAANGPAEWYCTECGEELPAE